MFCAGLLLSIADLLCRLRTANHLLTTSAHEPAQSNSMFPEAFPLPQEQGGQHRLKPSQPRRDRASDRCQYHTAIFSAFQLELDARIPGLTAATAKVQTFPVSTTARGKEFCASPVSLPFRTT